MSYFYFDHDVFIKDRYSRALIQWHLVKLDENPVNDHMAGAGFAYLRWVQEELGHQPVESKRSRTEESVTDDHVKRLRAALNQEKAIRTWIEQENSQL